MYVDQHIPRLQYQHFISFLIGCRYTYFVLPRKEALARPFLNTQERGNCLHRRSFLEKSSSKSMGLKVILRK